MAMFLFSYRVPADYVPGRPEGIGAWTSWFASMEASVTDIGKPIFESSALGDLGDGTKPGGYSMITADDLEAALTLAKGCPALRVGGGVEVGLLADLPADSEAQA